MVSCLCGKLVYSKNKCRACYIKEWRLLNPEKQKILNKRNSEKLKNNGYWKTTEYKNRKKEYWKRPNYLSKKRELIKTEKYKTRINNYNHSIKGRSIRQIIKANYNTKKRNIKHNFKQKDWLLKIKSTNGICINCKQNVGINKLTLDHIIPISKVENGHIYNINDVQPLCIICNIKKGNRL